MPFFSSPPYTYPTYWKPLPYGYRTGRAQRASARNQGAHNSPSMDLLPQVDFPPHASSQSFQLESDSGTLNADKEPSDSRSNSSLNLLDPPPAALIPAPVGRPKRKDKGKAKEVENPPLRVKEEPKSFSLHTPDVPNPNNLVRQFFSVDISFTSYILSALQ